MAVEQATRASSNGRVTIPEWAAELSPLGLMLLYAFAVHIVAAQIGRPGAIVWTLYLPYAAPLILALLCAGLAMWSLSGLRRFPGTSLACALWSELEHRGIGLAALALTLPTLLCLPLFLSVFSSFKALIPILHPFSWDGSLAKLDHALHGGSDPWRYLQSLLAYPTLIRVLDFIYHPVWSLGLFVLWTWQAMDRRDPDLRLQFFLAIPTGWIALGSIGGVIFSSAGPCYFAQSGGDPTRFDPLLHRLAEIHSHWPLVSQIAQRGLWDLYRSGTIGFGSGISAMPSVHVATAFIAVLFARKYGIVPFALSLLLFVSIALGSVLLGWHYAVDVYAGVLLVSLVWLACGVLARRLVASLNTLESTGLRRSGRRMFRWR